MLALLDHLFGLASAQFQFFREGWGDLELLEKLKEDPFPVLPCPPLQVQWGKEKKTSHGWIRSGVFETPYQEIPLPPSVRQAQIEYILPNRTSFPVCIHFAATAEEVFYRRRAQIALPLAKQGVGSIILGNPFYGKRRPPGQKQYKLRRFIEFIGMIGSTLAEGRALLEWLKREGIQHRGASGYSMGGFIAAALASQVREPLAVVPCFTPHSGVIAFIEGPMRRSVRWKSLEKELKERKAQEVLREFLQLGDLTRLAPPVLPQAAIIVAGKYDRVVPPSSPLLLHQHWKGSMLRWLPASHVTGFFLSVRAMRQAILDAFAALQTLDR